MKSNNKKMILSSTAHHRNKINEDVKNQQRREVRIKKINKLEELKKANTCFHNRANKKAIILMFFLKNSKSSWRKKSLLRIESKLIINKKKMWKNLIFSKVIKSSKNISKVCLPKLWKKLRIILIKFYHH